MISLWHGQFLPTTNNRCLEYYRLWKWELYQISLEFTYVAGARSRSMQIYSKIHTD